MPGSIGTYCIIQSFEIFTFYILDRSVGFKNKSAAGRADINLPFCFFNNLLFCAVFQKIDRKY